MAYEEICVFCGSRLGALRATTVNCGGIYEPSCRSCAKELSMLDMEERCRRALRLGHALRREELEERMKLAAEAEAARPTCLRCGGKLRFEPHQCFDNSPLTDSLLLSTGFEVLPACCEDCGKYEFYKYETACKNPHTAYLIDCDTSKG